MIRSKMDPAFLFRLCILVTNILLILPMEAPLMPGLNPHDKIAFKGKPVAPCVACRKLVTSFLTGLNETSRANFAGGDADWERNKLGIYENSEVRFIEIQERLCSEVGLGKDQCYNLAEQYESELEDWFYEKRHKNVDLHKALCIDRLRVCCPNNTYGPDCIPCPGGLEKPCGGRGKCLKGGTRETNATCFCDAGYEGELCDQCKNGYYQELNSSELSCKLCDRACKRHCRGPGPQNCEVCSFGYRFVPNEGCVEHFDDYKNKIKMDEADTTLEDTDEADTTLADTDEANTTLEDTDEANITLEDTADASSTDLSEKEEIRFDSNIEDPAVDVTHIEL